MRAALDEPSSRSGAGFWGGATNSAPRFITTDATACSRCRWSLAGGSCSRAPIAGFVFSPAVITRTSTRASFSHLPTGRPDDETPRQLSPAQATGLPPNPLPRRPGSHRIVLVPAGARNLIRDDALRRWPAESYAELASALLTQGHEVVLAGGPDDRWASPIFATLAPLGITDLIGELSLLETLALLDSAEVTVTHDTGPLHLAGLTRTCMVGLFGPTDPHGRLPQRAGCVALWGGEGFACRPCYDGRDYAPCSHNGCIRQVTPAMVLAEIESLLSAIGTGVPLPLPRILTPPHTPIVQVRFGSQSETRIDQGVRT